MWFISIGRDLPSAYHKKLQWRKVKQMQRMWKYHIWCKNSETTQWRKAEQMQQMWFCICSGSWFEETFENTQWRKNKQCNQCDYATSRAGDLRTYLKIQWGKVKQMQSMWLCILSGRQFGDTFDNTQWRKAKQMQSVWLCMLLSNLIWADIQKDTVGKSRTAWRVTDWLINKRGRCWRCYCINHWIKWITWEDVSKILHLRPNKDDDKYPDKV